MSNVSTLRNRKIYLHGDLSLEIIEARNLPNMDLCSERFRRVISVFGSCGGISSCSPFTHHRHDHSHHHSSSKPPPHLPKPSPSPSPKPRRNQSSSTPSPIITSDPYVNLTLSGSTVVARTRVISNNANPIWDEHFNVPLAHPTSTLDFIVKDNDLFGADYIGTASLPAYRVASGEWIDEWLTIYSHNGKPAKIGATIHVRLKFVPCDRNPRYRAIGRGGVERSYFPMRHGGAVTLYQDAHVEESEAVVEGLELAGSGAEYSRESCWEDICHAILEAHHMVYIVGWSIYHKVKMVRGREGRRKLPIEGEWSLGDLLKYKSQEGVRVLLLVWDDKTSHNKFYFKTDGLMQTHDEETKKFFKHSSVVCKLSPRYASNKLSIIKQQVVGTLYTHHQKCVIVDTQAEGNNRKITAFLGGLDLCDGRYDTPEHRLFRDLDTTFQNDFHNPSIPVGSKGPRQPWHDLHCKIEGPAAYDVLKNFEQRWRKATKWSHLGGRLKGKKHWHDDSLLKVERISWILSPSANLPDDDPKLWVKDETDPENWHVQIFRSIDSGSVKGFPTNVKEAEDLNLVCAKDLVIDRSIQTAYVEAIRSAEHFIYIENQYFIGSSYAWPNYQKAGADNLIPMELALKIVNKIRAKERFSVYIVIPMWPEGDPSSASVQEILFWQSQTMQMMYQLIAKELKQMKIEGAHPQDYLNFYCLGSREEPQEGHDSYYAHGSLKHGRFMVYVHAKGMIVDDEYVLLGSANINQRSLAGQRDTEIAMGAYQPFHTWDAQKEHPRGQVYGYRMSLWAEHMGEVDPDFKEAGSLECVQKVNQIAEVNWNIYVQKDYSPLKGHLLKYPIQVDSDGVVDHLPGWDHFPDFDGKILGSPKAIPDALTT